MFLTPIQIIVSQFFEILVSSQDIWENVSYVHEINHIS